MVSTVCMRRTTHHPSILFCSRLAATSFRAPRSVYRCTILRMQDGCILSDHSYQLIWNKQPHSIWFDAFVRVAFFSLVSSTIRLLSRSLLAVRSVVRLVLHSERHTNTEVLWIILWAISRSFVWLSLHTCGLCAVIFSTKHIDCATY